MTSVPESSVQHDRILDDKLLRLGLNKHDIANDQHSLLHAVREVLECERNMTITMEELFSKIEYELLENCEDFYNNFVTVNDSDDKATNEVAIIGLREKLKSDFYSYKTGTCGSNNSTIIDLFITALSNALGVTIATVDCTENESCKLIITPSCQEATAGYAVHILRTFASSGIHFDALVRKRNSAEQSGSKIMHHNEASKEDINKAAKQDKNGAVKGNKDEVPKDDTGEVAKEDKDEVAKKDIDQVARGDSKRRPCHSSEDLQTAIVPDNDIKDIKVQTTSKDLEDSPQIIDLISGKRMKDRKLSETKIWSTISDQCQVTRERFLEMNEIIPTPHVLEQNLGEFYESVSPYLIQRIKLWGAHVLTASKLNSLVKKTAVNNCTDPDIDDIFAKPKNVIQNIGNQIEASVSRVDFITFVLLSCDCFVAQDILKILAKFSIAMPFIIRDFKRNRYVCMLPLLRDITVRWERKVRSTNTIIENYLFRSPFKMVVAIRLGSNHERPGKSAILNSFMKKEDFFSSRGEPGGMYGKPHALDGSVEFTWLTQETASNSLWQEELEMHYNTGSSAILLLANLHGDVTEHFEILDFLKTTLCSFIIFVMPSITKDSEQLKQLKANLQESKCCYYISVDSRFYDESNNRMMQTTTLKSHTNLSKFLIALKNSIGLASEMHKTKQNAWLDPKSIKLNSTSKVVMNEAIYTDASQAFIDLVEQNTCHKTKQMLKLQQDSSGVKDRNILISQNSDAHIDVFMDVFLKIFGLLPSERSKAIIHIETELSMLSALESTQARQKLMELKAEKKNFGSHNEYAKQMEEFGAKINEALETVDDINLGLEHFFRELNKMYKSHLQHQLSIDSHKMMKFPQYCGDMLLDGMAVELFNGDTGTMPAEWLAAVCNYLDEKIPNLRIFVISIIGLQSSGKSTLLNALFCCKFAVSVGRCSRGLLMRLVFLEDRLKKSEGFDALLIIDTEGLASPEQMNDKASEEKDRKMATFAISVSHLTIVNAMGETIKEITEILQIAMFALARLGKEDMASDILLVQHNQECDEARLAASQENFCKAVEYALKLLHKNNVELGVLSDNCLENFIRRIQGGNFVKHFSPLKDGSNAYAAPSQLYHRDVVDLFETILLTAKGSHNKKTFHNWCRIVEGYWGCVSKENFAIHFKNLVEFVEFMERRQKIAYIKEAIENSIHHHRLLAEREIRKCVLKGDSDKNQVIGKIESKILVGRPYICEIMIGVQENQTQCEFCKKATELINEIEKEATGQDHEQKVKDEIVSFNEQAYGIAKNMLSQMFDATVIQDKITDSYSNILDKELKKVIDPNKLHTFTPKEIQLNAHVVWEKMEYFASKQETMQPIEQRIHYAICEEYKASDIVLELYSKTISLLSLRYEPAFMPSGFDNFKAAVIEVASFGEWEKSPTFLKVSQQSDLVHQLEAAASLTALSNDSFQHVMIGKLKKKVTEIHDSFQKQFQKRFLQKFVWLMHAFALQAFRRRMEKCQEEWNRKYSPKFILRQKKSLYMQEIETRLMHGFGAAADGIILARDLIQASRQVVINDIENDLVFRALGIGTLNNAEVIRLNYFQMLVEEVKSKNTQKAIDYFFEPKATLEQWYKEQVDKFDEADAVKKYQEKMCKVVNDHLVKFATSDIKDIQKYIQEYACLADQVKFSINLNAYDNSRDVAVLMENVNAVLRTADTNITSCWFRRPSEKDARVMGRLGCTEYCPFCGAMCWESIAHREEHYTCHQPRGLRGLGYQKTHELIAHSCYSYSEKCPLYAGDEDNVGRQWRVVKKDYPDWKFINFPKQDFDQLMCWFFSQLNNDIATRMKSSEPKIKPATAKELEKNNCVDLAIDKILLGIKTRLSN